MVNSDTELLFPLRVIPTLVDLRNEEWKNLVKELSDDNCKKENRIAFSLLISKLAGCSSCNADSFRAMRGCTQCSRLIIKRYKGSDADLVKNYQECLHEVINYLNKRENIT